MGHDPNLPIAYQDGPIKLEPTSRAFRLLALTGFCTAEEAERAVAAIEANPDRALRVLAAIDVSFILSAASAELGRDLPTTAELCAALERIGVDPDAEGP